jgi:predicted dehydrogenase
MFATVQDEQQAQMPRVAIVGAGRMGRRHIDACRGLGFEIVGVADPNVQTLRDVGRETALPPEVLFPDASSMLSRARAELVIVATTAPTHEHYVTLAAHEAARWILCEKPMAPSLESCDRMIAACESRGVKLAVNHQMRFMDQYLIPKEMLTSGTFGPLASMTVIGGNFGLAMNASHYFEAFRFMVDEPPATVSAWLSEDPVANPRGAQFSDRGGSVRVTTRSGHRLYVEAGTDQGHGLFVVYGARLGRIEVDELTGRLHAVVRKREHRSLPTARYGMPSEEIGQLIPGADVVGPTQRVLRTLVAGEGFPDGSVGRMAVEVLVAAHVSAEQAGRVIDLDVDPLPTARCFPWA